MRQGGIPDGWNKLTENLERRGCQVRRFATGREAADYLDGQIDQTTVAWGAP